MCHSSLGLRSESLDFRLSLRLGQSRFLLRG